MNGDCNLHGLPGLIRSASRGARGGPLWASVQLAPPPSLEPFWSQAPRNAASVNNLHVLAKRGLRQK